MKLIATIGSNLVIRSDNEHKRLSNTIVAVDKKSTFVGTVLLVGPDVKQIKVGDRVHYGNDRIPIKVDQDVANIIVIQEKDVFVVVSNDVA